MSQRVAPARMLLLVWLPGQAPIEFKAISVYTRATRVHHV